MMMVPSSHRPLTEVLPQNEPAAVFCYVRHAGPQLLVSQLGQRAGPHGAAGVGFAEVAVILLCADPARLRWSLPVARCPGAEVSPAPVAADEFHHPAWRAQYRPHSSPPKQRMAWSPPGWQDGSGKSIIWLMAALLLRFIFSCCRFFGGRRCRCSSSYTDGVANTAFANQPR